MEVLALYLDTNIELEVTRLLNELGVVCTNAYLEGQMDEKSDFRILARATQSGLVLVTYDQDFVEISDRLREIGGLHHAGIILVEDAAYMRSTLYLAEELARMAYKFEGWPSLLYSQVYKL